RYARVILLAVVVVSFPEVGQEPIEESAAGNRLGRGSAERVVDVAAVRSVVQQAGDSPGEEAAVAGVRLLAEQHGDAVAVERLAVVQRVGDGPARGAAVVLRDRVGRIGL